VATRAITCPFCALACDDLGVGDAGVDTRGCPKAASGFAREASHTEHRVRGKVASLEEAADAAAVLLREARLPLITGAGADLAGFRALIALADRAGAVIDPWRSQVLRRNFAVTQESGALTATFAEIANRADALLIVGSDPRANFPRLFERLVDHPSPLARQGPPWLAYLGPAAAAPRGAMAAALHLEGDRLLDGVAALHAALSGRLPGDAAIAGVPAADFVALAERLAAARYGAILWEVSSLGDEGKSIVGALLRILRHLNRRTRCVGLPLAGSDNALGFVQALLWQTGWPAQISLAGGAPEHDPWRYDAARLVAAGEIDALLWVAGLSRTPPPASAAPLVALVAPDIALANTPAVEIRVGVPGLDHAGTLVRADTVVGLPLDAVRGAALPSIAAVAQVIGDRLGASA
jgi:formylmethanofuran dehydrogenase subunit B